MRIKIKVKDIPVGSILWNALNILGIKGVDLPKEYDEYECCQERGNPIDFTIINKINK